MGSRPAAVTTSLRPYFIRRRAMSLYRLRCCGFSDRPMISALLTTGAAQLRVEAGQDRLEERVLHQIDDGLDDAHVRIVEPPGDLHTGGDLVAGAILENLRDSFDHLFVGLAHDAL